MIAAVSPDPPPRAASVRPASEAGIGIGACPATGVDGEAGIAAPLDATSFSDAMARLGPFEMQPRLAVAVSGGRDSMALALLARDWAEARGGSLVAFTVDHGLRPDSAAEAATVQARLASLGIEATILRWDGTKPATRLQQAARAARYRLLREACRKRGLLHLLVAHHAGDQRETVAMRAARGSGPDGLAGMAALVEWPELRLLRPLLAVERARLTALLEARGIAWVEDPSNRDPRFERVRLRTTLAAGGQGPNRAAIEAAGAARAAAETAVAAAAVDLLQASDDGFRLPAAGLTALPPDIGRRLISRMVQALGGGDHPPREERLERAMARLCSATVGGGGGRQADFTFAGCHFRLRRDRTSGAGLPPAGAPDRVSNASGPADVGPDRMGERVAGGDGGAPSEPGFTRFLAGAEGGRGSGSAGRTGPVRTRSLVWIVRPENGRKGWQALAPAAFFACGAPAATHLVEKP